MSGFIHRISFPLIFFLLLLLLLNKGSSDDDELLPSPTHRDPSIARVRYDVDKPGIKNVCVTREKDVG